MLACLGGSARKIIEIAIPSELLKEKPEVLTLQWE